MKFSLTPVPHCLGTPGGFFAKTNKATMLHHLLTDHTEEVPYPADVIQDGNALIHVLKNLPSTFGGLCLKILDQMVSKNNFVFSTDSYYEHSIKAHKRKRRRVTQPHHLDAVRLGVVARCAISDYSDYTKLITQIIPQFRFELCASIRGYGSRRAETSYPPAEESIGDRFFLFGLLLYRLKVWLLANA